MTLVLFRLDRTGGVDQRAVIGDQLARGVEQAVLDGGELVEVTG